MLETLPNTGIGKGHYPLEYLPINYSIAGNPRTSLQDKVIEGLEEQFRSPELKGKCLPVPDRKTPLDQRPNTIVVFGESKLLSRSDSLNIHGKLPKPAAHFLLINTVDKLPDIVTPDMGLSIILHGASHCAAIFEGDKNPKRALWVSTQGNLLVITGNPEEIYREIARRTQIHYGSPFLTNRHNGGRTLLWGVWAQHSIHADISDSAHQLGDAGIKENEVNLNQHTPDSRLARKVRDAFNSNGIGKSMQSQLGLGVMGVTRSGGGKVEVDANPRAGHTVPVWAITKDGYIVPDIANKPLLLSYRNGSVETHESGLFRLVHSAALAGEVNSFEEALPWVQKRLYKDGFIPIQPTDLPSSDMIYLDHDHKKADKARARYIRIGSPNRRHFQKTDYACGSMHAAWNALSGFMEFDEFYVEGGFRSKVFVVNLDGHGFVAAGEDRKTVTYALINDIDLTEPEQV